MPHPWSKLPSLENMKQIPKLWKHQEEIVTRARELDYFALLCDPGVGKTAALITILREKYAKHKVILPTLILCPIVVMNNWKREFSVWSKIAPDRIHVLSGTGKAKALKLRTLPENSIVITNYESLIQEDVFLALRNFLGSHTSCLVLDESHKAKTPNSKRTKQAIHLADVSRYRYILTGTPVLNNLMDIYSQFRILDLGERFGFNFFSFRARYFEDKNRFMPSNKHFPNWQPIKNADVQIKELMAPVSHYVDKKTCLTLPPLVKKTIEVTMSKEQARLYESMKRDLIASIDIGKESQAHSIAELAITKALRLQQIVSGFIKLEGESGEEGKVVHLKENPRKDALEEILEDIAPYHKVLVWAVFHANYQDIREVCEKLKLGYAELHGLIKDKDSEADRFRTDDKVRVLIGNPFSAGIGLNLVEASYSIYYSRNFSLEADIQSEARNYRGGSTIHESITRVDLVTPNTIDEVVLKALANKQQLSDKILKDNLDGI